MDGTGELTRARRRESGGRDELQTQSVMPKLVFRDSTNPSVRIVELEDGTYSVGRAQGCRLIISHASVSSLHCEILLHLSEVIVRDRGSKNGTFINGSRVDGQMPVRNGQIIRFGMIEAELDLSAAPRPEDETYESAVFEHRRYSNRPRSPEPSAPHPHRAGDSREAAHSSGSAPDATGAFLEGEVRPVPVQAAHASAVSSEKHPSASAIRFPRGFTGQRLLFLLLLAAIALLLVWLSRRAS
jgi:hypothetical protein